MFSPAHNNKYSIKSFCVSRPIEAPQPEITTNINEEQIKKEAKKPKYLCGERLLKSIAKEKRNHPRSRRERKKVDNVEDEYDIEMLTQSIHNIANLF